MYFKPLRSALLAALFLFSILQHATACGYSYVSNCATSLNMEVAGVTTGFQVSNCSWMAEFDNHGFGTVTSLRITEATSITWESCTNNVFNAHLFYRIYEQFGSPGSFNSIELPLVHTTTDGNYRTKTREKQLNLDLLAGLPSGNYYVEIYMDSEVNFNNGTTVDAVLTKNNGGNYFKASFTVDNGQSGTLNVVLSNQQNVSCNGGHNGSALVNAANGTAPITYSWSNGANGPSVNGLSAGSYSVTATDASNETGTLNVNISQPTTLQANVSSTNESSASANNGSAGAQPFGGTPPYTYAWNNGATTATLNNLDSGSYTLTVTDDNGCTATGTVLITVSGNAPTNYCASKGGFPWLDWITNISLNTIDNGSGKAQYSDFTNISTDLVTGTGYTISIENSYSWQTFDEYFSVWIDYNRNGSFDEPSEIVFQGSLSAPPLGTPSSLTTGTFNVPSSADEGPTRMRAAIKRGGFPSPCEMIPFGEVEDYAINIVYGGPVMCSISSNVSNINCNNNNTPLDPTDDLFGFDLLVNGNGTGTGWATTINGQNFSGNYGMPLVVSGVPINAGAMNLVIMDIDSSTCSTVQPITPPASCSNPDPCSISAQTTGGICDDNSTPTDPSDDTYTFNLTVNGNNTGAGWATTILGQTQNGLYGLETLTGPFPINQGTQNIIITDSDDSACTTNLAINPPSTCSNGGGANYCSISSDFPWHEWIARVVLENLDNESAKTPFGNFTGLAANVTADNSYPISLTADYSWFTFNEHWKVWIDYNQDGQFQEPDEVAFSLFEPAPPNGTLEHTVMGTINIPATALEGLTRMRVAVQRNDEPMPCENLPFGEVEDYTINIAPNFNGGGNGQNLMANLNGTPNAELIDLYALVKPNAAAGHWELERSNGFLHFEMLQSGQTNNNAPLLIHEQDPKPEDGQNHYRLSLYDENGLLLSRTYTTVPFEHVAAFDLFPNPTSSGFSIQLKDMIGEKVRIEIYTQLGQPVYRTALRQVVDPVFQIPTADWRGGLYQVVVFPENRKMVSRQLIVDKR